MSETASESTSDGLREKLRAALRPYLHDNITQDAVHDAIEEIVDIVRPGEVLDCKTTLGTPIGHLFVDDWHDDKRSRCARCGILEADYGQPLAAPPEETP